MLSEIIAKSFEFIIFDRTPLIQSNGDRLTVQRVPLAIYQASYPAWFFDEQKFKSILYKRYEPIAEFDALGEHIDLEDGTKAIDRGIILRLKDKH
jgi:putative methyltransferase (TIGR04325 family)